MTFGPLIGQLKVNQPIRGLKTVTLYVKITHSVNMGGKSKDQQKHISQLHNTLYT